jgi:hypothetical protein
MESERCIIVLVIHDTLIHLRVSTDKFNCGVFMGDGP